MIRNDQEFSLEKYLNSSWLNNIKKELISGVVPKECNGCKVREDKGLKSTRGAFWGGYYGVGPEPEMDISSFSIDEKTKPKRIEIRFSNLCNFKCRMCDETSSSEIAKEKIKFKKPMVRSFNIKSISRSPDEVLNDLKDLNLLESVEKICFTGGEPMLIKQYNDYMDFLIEHKFNETVLLDLFTNCSVYNSGFIERVLQFKDVRFTMSIDGVGKTAEYQRHGTNWETVKNNIFKFNKLPLTIEFNTAITGYVLLDISSLAKFLMELYQENNSIKSRCYSVNGVLHFNNLNADCKEIALREIEKAIDILIPSNFDVLTNELKNIKKYLQLNNHNDQNTLNFIKYTKDLDKLRNENFEKVFGYKLY